MLCWLVILHFWKIHPTASPLILLLLLCCCVTRTHFVSLASIPLNTSTQALFKCTEEIISGSCTLHHIVFVYSKKRNSQLLATAHAVGECCVGPGRTDLRQNHARKTWYHHITSWPARAKNIEVSSEKDFYEYFNSEHGTLTRILRK